MAVSEEAIEREHIDFLRKIANGGWQPLSEHIERSGWYFSGLWD